MLTFNFDTVSLTCDLNKHNFPYRLNCICFFFFVTCKMACIRGECAAFRWIADCVLNNLASDFIAVILHGCNREYLGRRSTVIWVNSFNWFNSLMLLHCLSELGKHAIKVLNLEVLFRLDYLAVSMPNALIIRNQALNIQIRHQMIYWRQHHICKYPHLFTIAIVPHNELLVSAFEELLSNFMQILIGFLRDCR